MDRILKSLDAEIAKIFEKALEGKENIELPPAFNLSEGGGSLFGGIALIGIGGLLFLNTRFGVSMAWIRDWWPLAVIGVGAYLLYQGIQSREPDGEF